jgi:methionine-R-sulfoxide reductase
VHVGRVIDHRFERKGMPRHTILLLSLLATISHCQQRPAASVGQPRNETRSVTAVKNPYYSRVDTTRLSVSDEEWKKILPVEVYRVAREQDTEAAFTGAYWNFEGKGAYFCAVCGNALFRSDAKFASTCGWPSFFEAIRPGAVEYRRDVSFGMERTEVLCGRCASHLGHIFDDGPPPTGRRFCMNSIVLEFEPETSQREN